MSKALDTPVLVAGGGPVGLTLAMDLAWRGVPVVVAELRRRGEAPSVKCNHTSARSMEIFRRLGVAKKLRNAGLPPDYPNDCSYRTTTTGTELARIPIPCRQDRYTAKDGPDTWWPTAEPHPGPPSSARRCLRAMCRVRLATRLAPANAMRCSSYRLLSRSAGKR